MNEKQKLPVEDPELWAKIQGCPRCGGTDKIASNNTFLENQYYLSCYGCGHECKDRSSSFELAIETWNKQPKETSK